jgi:hypothetical protein
MVTQRLGSTLFSTLVGERFSVENHGHGRLELTLTEVTRRPQPSLERTGAADPFSLLFSGPRDVLLNQGTYTFIHSALGEHPIFIVPVGSDAKGYIYEAVFN